MGLLSQKMFGKKVLGKSVRESLHTSRDGIISSNDTQRGSTRPPPRKKNISPRSPEYIPGRRGSGRDSRAGNKSEKNGHLLYLKNHHDPKTIGFQNKRGQKEAFWTTTRLEGYKSLTMGKNDLFNTQKEKKNFGRGGTLSLRERIKHREIS